MSESQSILQPAQTSPVAGRMVTRWRGSSWRLLVSTSLSFGLIMAANAQAPTTPPPAAAPAPAAPQAAAVPAPPLASPEALDQAVAPIALYPDPLVAQILAAAAFPSQIAEAEALLQQHPGQSGAALAQQVNAQSWDPSVKALTQFPTVLAAMNQNLPWTVALGIDYGQQPQAVLSAVQTLRQRAEQAGTLEKCAKQEKIVRQGPVIQLQPVNPKVVAVPAYDPWVVYGPPLPAYPGWVAVPGAYITGPEIVFGVGIGIAAFAAFGWGWHHWGTDWGGRNIAFNRRAYFPSAFAGRPGFGGRAEVAGGHPGGVGRLRDEGRAGAIGHAAVAHAGGFRPGIGRAVERHSGGFFRSTAHLGGYHGAGGFHGGSHRR